MPTIVRFIYDGTCVLCGDEYPVEYLVECNQCDNLICKWCAEDHHGTCSELCFAIQELGEAIDHFQERMQAL